MRTLIRLAMAATMAVVTGCADSPTSPAPSKPVVEADFENLSNRELLVQVLRKLNALEDRVNREVIAVRAQVDSAILAGGGLGALGAPSAGAGLEIEATACAAGAGELKGAVEAGTKVEGTAEGHAGADIYGTGAKGKVAGVAMFLAKIVPEGKAELKLEVCVKLAGGGSIGTLRGSHLAATPAGVRAPPSALQPLLESMLQSATLDKIAAAALALQLNGSRVNQGLDAITALSSGDLGFGSGAAGLVAALPLPAGLSNLISNPAGVLQKVPEALQFAINQLCSQTFFTGELAQLASQGCSLRGQFPAPASLIGILQGLDGLPSTLGSLGSNLQGACAAINGMLPARIVISPVDVTFPLGIGDVRVFPGVNRAIFPGINSAC